MGPTSLTRSWRGQHALFREAPRPPPASSSQSLERNVVVAVGAAAATDNHYLSLLFFISPCKSLGRVHKLAFSCATRGPSTWSANLLWKFMRPTRFPY